MNFKNRNILVQDIELEIPLTVIDVKLSANDLLGIINGMKFEDKMDLISEFFCYDRFDEMEKYMLKFFEEVKK